MKLFMKMSDRLFLGNQLPGKWHDMKKPLIDLTPPKKQPSRNCELKGFISPNQRLSLLNLLQPDKGGGEESKKYYTAPNTMHESAGSDKLSFQVNKIPDVIANSIFHESHILK